MSSEWVGAVTGPKHASAESSESAFLRMFFESLSSSGVRCSVMRNYDGLPFTVGASDLDILCETSKVDRILKLARSAASEAGGALIGCSKSTDVIKIAIVGRVPDLEGPWWGIRIDLFLGVRFAGLPLIDDRNAWPDESYRGVPVLPAWLSATLGVVKEVLNNDELPQRYASDARAAVDEHWHEIEELLKPMGDRALRLLNDLLKSRSTGRDMRIQCRNVRLALLMHAALHRPFDTVVRLVRFQSSKVRRYAKPAGLVVAILGVDGAGKSTIIEAIKPVLSAATNKALKVCHLRPGLLPSLGRLAGKAQSGETAADPHGRPSSGLPMSLFRAAYLIVDYQLGYWFWVRPQIAKQPNIVLFDRYAYDLALDQKRFRLNLPHWLVRFFARLAPQPDLLFCLHGEPEAIAARKGELSVKETRRQIEALRQFSVRTPISVLISTDQGIDATRDEVLQTLCDFLASRKSAFS